MSMLRKLLIQAYLNQYMTVGYEQKGTARNTSQLFLRNTSFSWIQDFKTIKVIFMLLLFVILSIIYESWYSWPWEPSFIYCYTIHSTNFRMTLLYCEGPRLSWAMSETYSTNPLRATSRGRVIFNSVSINTLRRWTPSQSERTRCHFWNN